MNWIHLAQDRDQWRAIANTCSVGDGEFIDQVCDY